MKMLKIKTIISFIIVFIIGFGIVLAWEGPTANPPSSNTSAPINVSVNPQLKEGSLQSETDIRAPIYYDYPSTDYYADPAGNSWLYRLYSYDMRSDIFYDRNNTAYYVDPASTSRFNTINLGDVSLSSWPSSGIASESDTLATVTDRGNTTSDWIQSNSSVRAPLFYDSNNTGYYIDPASTSIINSLTWIDGSCAAGSSIRAINSTGGLTCETDDSGITSESDPQVGTLYNGYWCTSNGSSVNCTSSAPSSPWVSGGSYLYYDSSNFRAKIGKNLTNIDGYSMHGYRAEYGSGAVMLGVTESGLAGVSLKYGSHSFAVFNTSNGTSYFRVYAGENFIFDECSSSSCSTPRLIISRSGLTVAGSVIADIMYDRNNTGYYVNPASTSNFNTIRLGGVSRSSWPGGADTLATVTARGNTTSSWMQSNSSMRAPIFYDSNNTGYYVDPAGTANLYRVVINNTIQASMYYDKDNHSYYVNPNSTSRFNTITYYNQYPLSDRTIKKNIQKLSNPLDKILKLEGISFEWKDEEHGIGNNLGLIAQDVEKVYPELVKTDSETGLKSVQYSNLVAPLIEAIKDQQKQINELKSEVELLKN